jgi:heme exporter protein D
VSDGDGYDTVLNEVAALEDALRNHRQHVIDSASMSVLPTMVNELHDLDRRVSVLREKCERRRIQFPTPPV